VYGVDPTWNEKRAAGQVTFAGSDGWKQVLQVVDQMNKAGCFQQGATGMTNETSFPLLAQGKAITATAPASAVVDFGNLNPKLKWGLSAFPGDTPDQTRIFASPSNALAINAKTKQPDAARKLLGFLAQPANEDQFADLAGTASLNASRSGNVSDRFAGLKPWLSDQKKFFPLASLFWQSSGVYQALGTGIQGLLNGQASIDTVLGSMDKAWK
jgi:raffinose/stachyose/melibiose transport system substrate-binding protein